MKKFELTVNHKSARFIVREGEDFETALSRGAAALGYRGGAFCQPNFQSNRIVTVTEKPVGQSNARASYNGICSEI